MSSYAMTTLIGNEFDKVLKEFGVSDDKVEQNEGSDISAEDLVDEQTRQAANAQERQARQVEIEKKREETRQKIRDKYNIKKKEDLPTKTKNQQQGKINDLTTRIDHLNTKLEKTNEPEPQGFQPVKTMTDAFNSFKQKFGWK